MDPPAAADRDGSPVRVERDDRRERLRRRLREPVEV